jgi:Spy/CpxP family protein refolding chaperone
MRGHVKWPLAGVLGGLMILASGATPTEAHWAGRGSRVERPNLQAQLGLSADQVQAIREIHARQRDALRDTARALRDARRDLRAMILTEADEAAVTAKQAEVQELVGRMLEARTQVLREITTVLTPEQRGKMQELRREWPRHRRAPLAG